jgi:hypothetical protein
MIRGMAWKMPVSIMSKQVNNLQRAQNGWFQMPVNHHPGSQNTGLVKRLSSFSPQKPCPYLLNTNRGIKNLLLIHPIQPSSESYIENEYYRIL